MYYYYFIFCHYYHYYYYMNKTASSQTTVLPRNNLKVSTVVMNVDENYKKEQCTKSMQIPTPPHRGNAGTLAGRKTKCETINSRPRYAGSWITFASTVSEPGIPFPRYRRGQVKSLPWGSKIKFAQFPQASCQSPRLFPGWGGLAIILCLGICSQSNYEFTTVAINKIETALSKLHATWTQ